MDQFALDIPASVRSHFVVATDLNVSRPARVVADQLERTTPKVTRSPPTRSPGCAL